MISSESGAPANYEELFIHYMGFVKGLVARAGIRDEEVEDVASEILVRFIEKDALSWYDPEKKHDVTKYGSTRLAGERYRTARFSGFLRRFVTTYVLQYRDKQMTRDVKEPLRCEQPVGVSDDGTPTLWIEVYGGTVDPDTEAEYWEWVEKAAAHLAKLEVRGSRDLAKVFEIVVTQVAMDGVVNRKVIAKEFGVSDTAVCLMFRDLRRELEGIGWKQLALSA